MYSRTHQYRKSNMPTQFVAFWFRIILFVFTSYICVSREKDFDLFYQQDDVLIACSQMMELTIFYILYKVVCQILQSVHSSRQYSNIEMPEDTSAPSTTGISFQSQNKLNIYVIYVVSLGILMWFTFYSMTFEAPLHLSVFSFGVLVGGLFVNSETYQRSNEKVKHWVTDCICFAIVLTLLASQRNSFMSTNVIETIRIVLLLFLPGFVWMCIVDFEHFHNALPSAWYVTYCFSVPMGLLVWNQIQIMSEQSHNMVLSILLFFGEPILKFLCLYVFVMMLVRKNFSEVKILLISASTVRLMLKSDSDEAYRNVSVVLVLLCWLVHSVYLLQRQYFEPCGVESTQKLNDAESCHDTI